MASRCSCNCDSIEHLVAVDIYHRVVDDDCSMLWESLLIPHSTSAHSLIDGRDLLSFSMHRSASPSTLCVAPTAAGLRRNRGSIAITASPSLNLRIACSDPTSSRRTRHRMRRREEVDVLCRTGVYVPIAW